MSSSNLPMFRSLSILRRLRRGPAAWQDLVDWVHVDEDPTAYRDVDQKAGRKRVENDIKRLRDWGVQIEFRNGEYHLLSYGDFHPIYLTEAELDTLAFLAEAFRPGAPNGDAVQHLVQQIGDWLPERQRDSIPLRRQRLRIDLRRRDSDQIPPQVQAMVDRAIQQRRLLAFYYRSPGQADGELRRHMVQPWHLYFDTVRRHLYLDAYRLEVRGPHGVWKQGQWQKYRLGRILAEGLEILPDKLPPEPPRRPRYRLEYRLAPDIARTGEITRHFAETRVHEADEAGWVRVTAVTDDLFTALRLLLGYGPYCKVTGGPEARREMERLVRELAGLYGYV